MALQEIENFILHYTPVLKVNYTVGNLFQYL